MNARAAELWALSVLAAAGVARDPSQDLAAAADVVRLIWEAGRLVGYCEAGAGRPAPGLYPELSHGGEAHVGPSAAGG